MLWCWAIHLWVPKIFLFDLLTYYTYVFYFIYLFIIDMLLYNNYSVFFTIL